MITAQFCQKLNVGQNSGFCQSSIISQTWQEDGFIRSNNALVGCLLSCSLSLCDVLQIVCALHAKDAFKCPLCYPNLLHIQLVLFLCVVIQIRQIFCWKFSHFSKIITFHGKLFWGFGQFSVLVGIFGERLTRLLFKKLLDNLELFVPRITLWSVG